MKKIIIATQNQDKLREIRAIMEGDGVSVLSVKEAGIQADAEENGATFEENALIKARAVAAASGAESAIVLADDSGLEIDALGGEPGVYSARYMGEDTSYEIKNRNLIGRLDAAGGKDRSARFVCAVAAVMPDGQEIVVRETMEGRIGSEAQGENGFGYDPIFYPDGYDCSSAALTEAEKNAISHRGKALRAVMKKIL